ncbi:MAG TPA: 3'-5' exonuclease [Flavobacterium sp.]|jgi:DNA polymerase-3 subunit epsilon|uniref:3'-5' exonuclease n=1 Tax=Flavobacterium sp. TaxID=239 RepID=UPI002C371477|nr:3'-5' exonuclease [Flavobacterium sp.]MCA0347626.1 3'-5' exonuclease [Bacteroidota bacterium]HPW99096.1 3'-5' exonuclease [Flavobacterium sp.]HQA74130.1 3'-5' exonuclease [Flavobacterium sp.]
MFDWIKNINKEHPEFWKNYLEKFESKTKTKRYVILNTETSGLNPKKDVILSFGAIGIENDIIKVNDALELVILQYKYLHDNGLSNEFIIESSLPKFAEPTGIEELINYIGNATLVGHRIHFDIEMINEALDRIDCGKIKNEALDIEIMHQKLYEEINKPYSLDDLVKTYKIPVSEKNFALDDAYSMALLFLKLKSRLGF